MQRDPMSQLIERLRPYLTVAMLRWWIVGGGFIGVNLGLLWLCIDVAGLPVFPATLIASEVGTLLRFLVKFMNNPFCTKMLGI